VPSTADGRQEGDQLGALVLHDDSGADLVGESPERAAVDDKGPLDVSCRPQPDARRVRVGG